MSFLEVTIHGTPQQQGSKRNVGKVSIEANKNLAPWRADAIAVLRAEMERQAVTQFITPVFVEARFTYARPASHFRTGRNAHLLRDAAPLYKSTAPDLDKLCRAVGDALTQAGVVRDDALIVTWDAAKRWGLTPGVELLIADSPFPA